MSEELREVYRPVTEYIEMLERENARLHKLVEDGKYAPPPPKQASIPLQMSLMLEAFNQRLQALANETSERDSALDKAIAETGLHLSDYINDLARLTRRVDNLNVATMRSTREYVEDDEE